MAYLHLESLVGDITGSIELEDYRTALEIFSSRSKSLPQPTRKLFQAKIDKIETHILLASDLASKEAFQRLMRDGTLDASGFDAKVIPCVKVITSHAAKVLGSCSIEILNKKNR